MMQSSRTAVSRRPSPETAPPPVPASRPGTRAAVAFACILAALAPPVHAQQPIPLDTLRASAGSRAALGAASVTRSVDILDRTAIDRLPAASVAEVLARALGVDLLSRSAASADVAIRGSGFEQVLIMVDGVPVNDDQTGHFHLDVAVPLDAIERVEVLRGPASALYGSAAVGGVVNIVTRRRHDELGARLQVGSFGGLAGGLEGAGSRGAWAGRVSAQHDRADGHRPGTDHAVTQARVALDAPATLGGARLDLGFAARDFGAAGFYGPFASAYEETRTLTAAVSWLAAPGGFNVQPRLSFRRHQDDFVLRRDDPSFYRNLHTTRQVAGELVARWTAADRLNLAIGTDASWSDLRSTNLGDRDEHRLAAFLEIAAGHADAALLTTGLRLDEHSTFGAFLSPSIAAGLRASPRLRLRASASSGFRAPNWTERFYQDPANVGNPDLQPETFWTAELGAELRPHPAASLDLAGFVRRSDDMIDWARPAGSGQDTPWRTLNFQRATYSGFEVTARTALSHIHLTGRGSLLHVAADAADGTTSKYALRPLTRALSMEVALPLTTALAVSGRAAHHRRAGTPDGAANAGSESWQLLDGRVSFTRGPLQIFADATNLADARFVDVTGEPAPGRAFTVGGRVRR